jgi:hypothetical protein
MPLKYQSQLFSADPEQNSSHEPLMFVHFVALPRQIPTNDLCGAPSIRRRQTTASKQLQ